MVAASASEFIQRASVAVALLAGAAGRGAAFWQPPHAYGDYARAARTLGLAAVRDPAQADLLWACDPSSPLGQPDAGLAARVAVLRPHQALVLDQAYEPLRLAGALALDGAALDRVWRLLTPNKALGLTGVRAAYAIAPRAAPTPRCWRLQRWRRRGRWARTAWPCSTPGPAPEAQDWLAGCRAALRGWKARQAALLAGAGGASNPVLLTFL